MAFLEELQQRTAAARAQLFGVPVIQHAMAGEVRLEQYTAFLREAYHHVKHTVPLLLACASRLGADREFVGTAVAHYVEEERGHDEWILQDLRACGVDPHEVRLSAPGEATQRMVDYVYGYIEQVNPVGFFGMAHVLEGTSSALATRAADAIGKALRLPPRALTYLTSHGRLDQDHVQFFASVVNPMAWADREAVVEVAERVYRLYADIFRGLPR